MHPVPISLPPQMIIDTGLPAHVSPSEIQSTGQKPLAVVPLMKQIFVCRLCLYKTSSDVLSYIQEKTRADNIKVDEFIFSYARDILSFKTTLPNELFLTICSSDF